MLAYRIQLGPDPTINKVEIKPHEVRDPMEADFVYVRKGTNESGEVMYARDYQPWLFYNTLQDAKLAVVRYLQKDVEYYAARIQHSIEQQRLIFEVK